MTTKATTKQPEKTPNPAKVPDKTATSPSPVDVDISRIVRPERFITPDVSGLTVPRVQQIEGKLVHQWALYLQWADGKRECRHLKPTIALPDKSKLWINPIPGRPTQGMFPTWSSKSQKNWLERPDSRPDIANVFLGLRSTLTRFIYWPEEDKPHVPSTVALWIMFTYIYPAWSSLPYLYIGGPTDSGKSRVLLEVLRRLVFRPLVSISPTASSVFRSLEDRGGVFLFDEAEQIKNPECTNMAEMMPVLLGGYMKGAGVTRSENVKGGGFSPKSFNPFGPKALACIRGLPPTLANRCITVTMTKAPYDSSVHSDDPSDNEDLFQEERDRLHEMVLGYGSAWMKLPPFNVCPQLGSRNRQLWQPLLALAAALSHSNDSNSLHSIITKYAHEHIKEHTDDTMPLEDQLLLYILGKNLRLHHKIKPGEILKVAESDYGEYFPERKYTAKGISTILKRYKLRTDPTRVIDGYRYFWPTADNLKKLKQIEKNYRIPANK